MSVAEQAIADSRRILEAGLLDIFFPDASGNVLAASNADFYNAFLNLVGGGEAYRNRDGSVRQNLSPRIRAAVLAAMLNPERRETVERLLDNPEGYNALINGLMQSAANLAELANKPEYDLSGELSQAVELYIEMHDKGQTVAEFEAQPDMFREQPSAEVMFLCRLFEANQKSSSGISGVLKEYAAQCKKIDTTTADLFGEEDPSKLDKLQTAYDHYATDLAQGMDNLRALDRGNSAYANFDERKLNDKETLKNLTPEEILERIKSVKSVSFPVERLDENFNLKYYWNWFEKNLLDREIPTAIRRNAVFKKGHFFKLIAGGKNKGFIKGYTTPEDAFKAIKKGKVLLHDKDLAPEGFSMARARQMPLVLDVLQDPFFVLKDKKTKDFIFLKKYEGGNDWMAVMFNDTDMGIISWHQKNITRAFAEKNTIVKQKNGVDFLAQPRESSKRDESLKTLSESENNSGNQENSSKKWREVSEPIKQKFSSGNTSLRQIAAGFKKIDFKPGTTNFDLGGGKFDEGTKYLETKGVKNFVFDPVNRDSKTNKEAFEIVKNGGFDTTTCNNVLNVISEANVRDNIILQAAKSLRPNGTAYFTVYEGDGSGKGRQSQKDSWQEHRKTVDYLGEIKKHFGDVSLKNKVITARKPILLNEKASWFMDDSFENPVRWKDDADISDISAKVKKIIDSISDKKNKHIEVLRKISDTEADFLLKKTGLDLKGYSHSIDNYSILHILKKHGSEKELQRGQIPVTIKDIQNFPTIVSDYDDVKYAGKSKIGRDTIRFEKNIGDNLVLVFEEMRIGKKLLALSTMYIQKRKKLTSNANASSNTSETLSTSSDFQESANTPEDQENNSRLKALLRQDRRENPVIWASIVLAKQILLGRAITSARLDRVLPPERFDGTKREYAVNRAREIAERYRADKEKFGNDLNLGVQRAENDLYWTRDVVEEMYASFRRDGEEYGIARQRLMEWLKEQRRRDLETVKGLSSEELGIDVPAAIEDALEKEPERRKPGENTAEESGGETFEASGEGIDAEIESAREKPAPSSIRDIIGKIRAGVTKAAKARGMDEAARRRAYRNTLAEVLRESAKRLTYGREREAIMKKISDLSAKGYSVIKIKDGERAGQKIDNYTLRAEHIALRIFNRGVRDTKRELSEKFEKIVSRKGKKPSRMERDDKRALAGAVQMRVYNIKRYSEMDAAELEAEYSATVDRLENVEKNFAERIRHYGAFAKAISKEIRKRAAIVQYGLPPFPASDTIQYRPLCGQSKRRKREQKSSNPKMRCITCESDKTLARLISIKLDLSLYASAPDSYCHASLAA